MAAPTKPDDAEIRFDAIAADLLRTSPSQFVAARTQAAAAARADGDKELARQLADLRKPTMAAWAVNLLAHQHQTELEEFVALGRRLRAEQLAVDAATMREIGRQRSALVRQLTQTAASDAATAGVRLSAAVVADIESTLTAAFADEDCATAVLAGRLTAPLHYAGLGFVGTVAAGPRPARSAPPHRTTTPRAPATGTDAAAQQFAAAAARRDARRRAEQELAVAEAEAVEAERHAAALRDELSAAQLRVASVQRELQAALEAEQRAETAAQAAAGRVAHAHTRVQQVHERLADLT